jgi:hypothetical protein
MDTGRHAFGMAALLLGAWSAAASATTPDFSFTVDTSGGAGHYAWDVSIAGGPTQKNPTLYLRWGNTYTLQFAHNAPDYPFWVTEYDAGAYPSGADVDTGETGLSVNPVDVTLTKTITFEPRSDQPDAFYYVCGCIDTEMAGAIRVVIFKAGFD